MKNRNPTKPNRYAVYDDDHNFIRYEYHERADEPTEDGDALDMENLLPYATCDLLGIPRTSVPKDAFNTLSQIMQYWWRKSLIVYIPLFGNSTTVTLTNTAASKITISYSASISVNQSTQEITLVNPSTMSVDNNSGGTTFDLLKGKYFKGCAANNNNVYFAASNAVTGQDGYDYHRYITLTNLVGAARTTGESTYLSSPAIDAYPTTGDVSGYSYTFLGKALDRAICSAKIEVGSYVGTGLSGSANKNSFVCSFPPKLLMLKGKSINGATLAITLPIPQGNSETATTYFCYTTNNAYITAVSFYVVGNIVYWWGGSYREQFNESGELYSVTAIG